MKSVNIIVLISLSLLLSGCNLNNEKRDVLRTLSGNSKNNSLHCEIIYRKKDLIFCLTSYNHNEKETSCETLYKKTQGYYSKIDVLGKEAKKHSYNLILSTLKDTSYSCQQLTNKFNCNIGRVNDSLFKSTVRLKGMSNFEQTIFFDQDYKILSIERDLNGKKFNFSRVD